MFSKTEYNVLNIWTAEYRYVFFKDRLKIWTAEYVLLIDFWTHEHWTAEYILPYRSVEHIKNRVCSPFRSSEHVNNLVCSPYRSSDQREAGRTSNYDLCVLLLSCLPGGHAGSASPLPACLPAFCVHFALQATVYMNRVEQGCVACFTC